MCVVDAGGREAPGRIAGSDGERSLVTLGDRLEVLGGARWPKPEVGEA